MDKILINVTGVNVDRNSHGDIYDEDVHLTNKTYNSIEDLCTDYNLISRDSFDKLVKDKEIEIEQKLLSSGKLKNKYITIGDQHLITSNLYFNNWCALTSFKNANLSDLKKDVFIKIPREIIESIPEYQKRIKELELDLLNKQKKTEENKIKKLEAQLKKLKNES
jgi:hypothetical protein